MGDLHEILDEIRDVALELERLNKKIIKLWRYTDRNTGKQFKSERVCKSEGCERCIK